MNLVIAKSCQPTVVALLLVVSFWSLGAFSAPSYAGTTAAERIGQQTRPRDHSKEYKKQWEEVVKSHPLVARAYLMHQAELMILLQSQVPHHNARMCRLYRSGAPVINSEWWDFYCNLGRFPRTCASELSDCLDPDTHDDPNDPSDDPKDPAECILDFERCGGR